MSALDFRALRDAALREAEARGGVDPEPPAHLADALGGSEHLETRLEARVRRGPEGWSLRSVLIESRKVAILNLFVFPDGGAAAPVYAMEFVRFGPRGVVAVLDLVDLAPGCASGRALLDQAHARWPELVNADDAPDWYEECRSGRDFFLRPSDPQRFSDLAAVHEALLRGALDAQRASDAAEPAARDALAGYKRHHAAHSPGLPFLHRMWGEGFTTELLGGLLFA